MESLRNHIESQHIGKNETPCDEKKYKTMFKNFANMRSHWRLRHGPNAKLYFCQMCSYNDPIKKNVTKHYTDSCTKRDEKAMKRQKKSQLRNTKERFCYFGCGKKTTNENEHIINCQKALEMFQPAISSEVDKVNIIFLIKI